jgi:hypothetical protein
MSEDSSDKSFFRKKWYHYIFAGWICDVFDRQAEQAKWISAPTEDEIEENDLRLKRMGYDKRQT